MGFTPTAPNVSKVESASFSYHISSDGRTFLIEETILATPTPMADGHRGEAGAPVGSDGEADDSLLLALLRRRQNARLKSLGLPEDLVIDEEVVSFLLLTDLPSCYGALTRNGPSMDTLFGFTGGWVHPAVGYSVGSVIEDVDRSLAGIEKKGGRMLGTPLSMRLQRQLYKRGLATLLGFDARQTGTFFRVFFSSPKRDVFACSIGTSPLATLCAMVKMTVLLPKMSPRTYGRLIIRSVRGPGRQRTR